MDSATRLRSLGGSAARLALSSTIRRALSAQTNGEVRITAILRTNFPRASAVKVVDISGGCGAMYEVHVESIEFKGKRIVQQHQMINQFSGKASISVAGDKGQQKSQKGKWNSLFSYPAKPSVSN
ncbi:bolA-like protein 3 isoform X1 [Carcharodon carcharias]|uniref:bolA-like protein 3 isoform X1 n=1 Tax=Carcharodon carcharias TaxID=13397 RepID=UPI001B7EA042|nr:bolA-like protein 3 isoform X1 [Carcharodon carcharias]